jgi:orotidine-5'-phosphate decarboxylase
MSELPGKDRLIVALDVPATDRALELVQTLDNVSIFKIGWQLYIAGDVNRLLHRIADKRVFLDLKIPGDIGNTVRSVVEACVRFNVMFLTLSESMPPAAIRAARTARGSKTYPQLLTVPLLSSLDHEDIREMTGASNVDDYVVARAHGAVDAGCDGVIASGRAIKLCREALSNRIVIVSPGIRPADAPLDDHKRHTTPRQAVEFGADYLVVGRPILNDPDPRGAAQRVIDEIDSAAAARPATVHATPPG